MTTRPNMEQLEQEALELYSGLVRQDAAASARLRDLRDLQDEAVSYTHLTLPTNREV